MPKINGIEVEFRERLPAQAWWDLFPKVASVEQGDSFLEKFGWDDAVKLISNTIASWEFDGDPGDPGAYEELDFADVLALMGASFEYAVGLYNDRVSGEAEKRST